MLGTESLTDPWLHWPGLMAQQAALYQVTTNLQVVLELLQSQETVDPSVPATYSNFRDSRVQLILCYCCLSVEWCSSDCMEQHWRGGHREECEVMEEIVFGEVTWEPGPAE